MKRTILSLLTAAIVLLTLLTGCGKTEKEPVTIWHVSDLHYLAPELIEDRDYFISVMRRSDGKVTHYAPEICASFVSAALDARPDAVIISGDLTLNGALTSHTALAEILSPLREAGIKVLLMPGNHDIGSAGYRFTAGDPVPVPGVTTEEFEEIYADFGYSDAISRDGASLSYMAELDGGVRVLVVDTNSGSYGTVTQETLDWAAKQLRAAKRAGCTVIAVSHQNLFRHSPLFAFGYELNNSDELAALYKKYGVQLNLSGHLHIQHIVETDTTAEIAVSALSVTPNQYGVLTLDENHAMRYSTAALTVSAEENGVPLDFARYSAELFDACTEAKTAPMLEEMGLSEEEYASMLDTAKQMNREYFWGAVTAPDEAAYALWSKASGFFPGYLALIYEEIGVDHNHWHR